MNVIDRYVAWSFLSSFVILLLVGMGLYIVGDLMVNLDEFTEDRSLTLLQVAGAMGDYYLYNVPLYYKQLAGPVMALAGAFTLAVMLRRNELTALVAAGVPLQRLAAPVFVCALGLAALWAANAELLIPRIAPKIARQHREVVGQSSLSVSFARDNQGATLIAMQLYPREGRLYRVFIFEPGPDGRPLNLITADSADWDAQRRVWRLDERGRRQRFVEDAAGGMLAAQIATEAVSEYAFDMSPEEMQLWQRAEFADLLSVSQMNGLLAAEALPMLPAIRTARHVRLTQPILQMILLLLAIPFFLSRSPTNVLAAGGRALLLCGLFFGATFVAHSIISSEWALLVTWLPILVFGPVAVQLMANART